MYASTSSSSSEVRARLRRPCANEPSNTKWLTRSGLRTAYAIATGPPCEMPSSGNRSSPAASMIDFEVAHPRLEGELGHVPVRQPAATFVVTHEPVVARQPREPVAPDHGLAVVVEMIEPVRDLHQWRTLAHRGVGETHAIVGRAESDLLRRKILGLGQVAVAGRALVNNRATNW